MRSLAYPATLTPDREADGFTVTFPDLRARFHPPLWPSIATVIIHSQGFATTAATRKRRRSTSERNRPSTAGGVCTSRQGGMQGGPDQAIKGGHT